MNNFTITLMTTEEEMDGKGYVHWKTWQETYKGLMPDEYLENITLEKCVELAHRWPQNTLLLKKGNEIIGYTCYGDNTDGDGEVIAIYLLAEYQGKKLGYALMNAAFEQMTDKGKVTLWVLKGNEKAIKFYERYGFEFDGIEKACSVGTELRMVFKKQKKQVIHIFGASGSGTSTLGKKISELWGYAWLDTDDYFWEPTNPPFQKKREVAERLRMIKEDIAQNENVVLTGSLTDWGDELIPFFTLAVRVVTATEVRLERIRQREKERFGERIAPGGDMYENHVEFLDWAGKYDTGSVNMRSKAKHDEWEQLLHCPLVIVDGAEELEKNCGLIKALII